MSSSKQVAWVFKHGEQFVGLDLSSGGYDYLSDNVLGAKLWLHTDKAHEWARHFRPRSDEWSLHPVLVGEP